MNKELDPCYFPSLDGKPGGKTKTLKEVIFDAGGLTEIFEYCHSNNTTKYSFFGAIWSVILHRFTDMNLLTFGMNTCTVGYEASKRNGYQKKELLVHEVSINSNTRLDDLFGSIVPIANHRKHAKFNTGLFFSASDVYQNAWDPVQRNLSVLEASKHQVSKRNPWTYAE